jgi:PadR family transcriptional regulator AphA
MSAPWLAPTRPGLSLGPIYPGATMTPSSPLNRTSYLVLGLIGRGQRTGYAMKQAIDRAAQFFWAVSYGQIYPELKKLESAGMLSSHEELTGARGRTAYELTDAGEAELLRWLAENDDLLFELRAEGLLKLFLAVDLGREQQLGIVRGFRAQVEQQMGQVDRAAPPREIGRRVRDYGQRMLRLTIGWCEEMEAAILAGEIEAADRRASEPIR